MFCPNCGSSNPDDARFCANCATPLQVAEGEGAGAPPAPPATPGAPPQWSTPQPAQAGPSLDWSKIFFIPRLIEYISHGSLFRRIVAGFLVAASGITALSGLAFAVVLFIGYVDRGGLAILGGLASLPLMLVGTYMFSHAYLVRARTVRDMPESEYTVIPIMSILLKLAGELGLIGGVVGGVQGLLMTWFLGSSPLAGMMNPYGGYGYYGMGGGEAFILGVIFLIGAIIYGFVILLVNYLLSELVVIVADIARDVRALRAKGVAEE